MSVKLLTEHHLRFLSLKGGCIGSSESTLVKMPHCWKSHVMAHLLSVQLDFLRSEHLRNITILHLCYIDLGGINRGICKLHMSAVNSNLKNSKMLSVVIWLP